MSIRLITGRAGSGKTHWCQSQICAELGKHLVDGPRLIMLVPEQAALQMERGLLGLLETYGFKTLGRCEVLSFRRLANRVLKESAGPSPTPLTTLGRQMALRLLISRHRKSLREFAKVAERGSFIREISRGIGELLQESVSLEQLEASAKAAEEIADPTAARLHDAALLYRVYLEYLGSDRVDPEGVLDLARARMHSAKWLQGMHVYIDGFAGLTRQQVRMLVDLAGMASQISIAFIMDDGATVHCDPNQKASALPLFARTQQTWYSLERAFRDQGISMEEPLHLRPKPPPRFIAAPQLAAIEKDLFNVPPIIKVEDRLFPEDAPVQNQLSGLRIIRAADRRGEVEAAIRCVLDLVQQPQRRLRFRDIAIIVRDLAPYHDILSATLHEHVIPYFIDRRRPTHHHPLVQLVRGLLLLQGNSRFDDAIIRIMKSGLSGVSDDNIDALENYLLAFNVSSAAAWQRRWTRPMPDRRLPRATRGEPVDPHLRDLNAARDQLQEALQDLWPTDATRSAHPNCKTWVRRLYATLERLRVTHTLAQWHRGATLDNRLDEAEEHEHVWTELIKLLDELDGTLGDESMTARQFREVIESGLADFTIGLVPPTLDQLLIGSIERSRHPAIKAAFVLGFCEGGFPARIGEDTIFGDAERTFLAAKEVSLGRTRDDQQLDERALAYIALTRASEFLWLSYPNTDSAGRKLEPSAFLPSILAAAPDVRIEMVGGDEPDAISTPTQLSARTAFALREWASVRQSDSQSAPWLAMYDWARKNTDARIRGTLSAALQSLAPIQDAELSPVARTQLWPPPHQTSITQLESLAECPYKHFSGYGLRLAERARGEVSRIHLGNLYHEMLEQFVNHLIETGEDFTKLTDSDIASRVRILCDQLLPLYADRLGLSESDVRKTLWRANREMPFALRAQQAGLGQTALRPRMTEKQFGSERDGALPALRIRTSNGETVLVRGKIDRVDFVQSGPMQLAVVFDYKRTLGKRLKLDEVYHGIALQLLAYLLVLRDAGERSGEPYVVPGGAFYLPLLASHSRVDHPSEADAPEYNGFGDLRPRGIVDFDWIDHIDPSVRDSGKSQAFAVARKKADGEISNVNTSDAVRNGVMLPLLDHVRARLTALVDQWLEGDIRVYPIRMGNRVPCTYCPFRSVCRFEFATHKARSLPSMSRSDVMDALTQPAESPDHGDREVPRG